MKRFALLFFTLVFGLAVAAIATEGFAQSQGQAPQAQVAKPEGKPATLSGEVIDLHCYMEGPASATGAGHSKCANDCLAKGLPAGFLTPDGTLYVIVGNKEAPANPLVKDFVGKQSTITGTITQHNGLKAINLASISEAKG